MTKSELTDEIRLVGRDAAPFKIIARGDCTSRRLTALNPHLFPNGLKFIQNQKSPFIFFLDAIEGKTATVSDLESLCDVTQMPGSLPGHYLGQADRDILLEKQVDLIMIDTWADMNFEIWEHIEKKWKCWVHPKYLRDPKNFHNDFRSLGRRTLTQSVNDAKKLIQFLRQKNPNAPVLILNQQIDYYSKMNSRKEFYDFGTLLEKEVDNSYFGGALPKDKLDLDDVGSCGPGQTLHFKGATYLQMLRVAFKNGLSNKIGSGSKDIFFATDNPERITYPLSEVDFRYHSHSCQPSCGKPEKTNEAVKAYIKIEGVSETMRWSPAVIDMGLARDYEAWEHSVKKRYDRIRMKNKSIKSGFVVHPFHHKLHIPDIYEIHHSSATRSGGEMRGDYLSGIAEMGGAPNQKYEVQDAKCPLHWTLSFGVFQLLEGHKQGKIVTNERLIGYINLRRFGDILLYSRIMGHADYLKEGIMYHLHFDIVRWASKSDNERTKGLSFIMYGGVGNGGLSLWQWKRTVGFKPFRLVVRKN